MKKVKAPKKKQWSKYKRHNPSVELTIKVNFKKANLLIIPTKSIPWNSLFFFRLFENMSPLSFYSFFLHFSFLFFLPYSHPSDRIARRVFYWGTTDCIIMLLYSRRKSTQTIYLYLSPKWSEIDWKDHNRRIREWISLHWEINVVFVQSQLKNEHVHHLYGYLCFLSEGQDIDIKVWCGIS